jgi:hypothetical protein
MDPNSDTALQDTTPVVPDVPSYATSNDLDFVMTPEEEQAFVNDILGEPTKAVEPIAPVVTAPVVEEPVAPVIAPVVTEPVTPVVEEPVAPTEIEPIKTDDLWVEVDRIVTDDLGDEVIEKIKLTYDPTNPGAFIPEDFTAKNTKQLADILETKAEMAKLYSERKTAFDTAQEDIAKSESVAIAQKAQLDAWDAEIADLIEVGAITAPKLKEGDDGYLDDPSIKETDAVFAFMTKTNAERAEKGIGPIVSFGTAFAMFQKDADTVAAQVAKDKEIEDTKTKGAMVGGSSASSSGGSGKSVYQAGSANSIWQVPVE